MNLSHFVVLDLDSGTFFDASNAYIMDTSLLTEDELDDFNNGTDSDRREIAERHGIDLETLNLPA